MKKILLLTLLSLFSGILHGQDIDGSRLDNILKGLQLDRTSIKEELCVEKKMPNREDSYIAVIPVLMGQEKEYTFAVQNYILITDSKGAIKNKYWDSTELTSVAASLTRFTIDTGLYTIGADIRAFGVKANFVGGSRTFPYDSEKLSLYYPEGKSIKKVLDQFEMDFYRGEWDGQCNGVLQNNNSYILLDSSKTNGFTDLKIKIISVTTTNNEVKGGCDYKETSKTLYRTLKFKNGHYQ